VYAAPTLVTTELVDRLIGSDRVISQPSWWRRARGALRRAGQAVARFCQRSISFAK
jgi:hypothetical protein